MSTFDRFYERPDFDFSRIGSSQEPSNQSMESSQGDMEYDALLKQFSADGVITDEERAVLSAASGSQATQPQEPVTFLPYADDVAPSRVNALSVFTPGGDLKPGIDVNAITPSPEMLPVEAAPKSALLEMLERGDERVATGLPRQDAPGIIDAPSPVVDPFTGKTIENPTPFSSNNSLPAGMTMNQAAIMNALPDQVQEREGMDINQQAISNALVREETAPPTAQTLSQYLRYEDSPEQRTEQFVDEQGRLRFRPTREALRLQSQPEATQVPVSALSDFERQSLLREARLAERDRRPGETQTQRDTRIAQSRTTGAQTEGLSFDEARRRAEGELAARGVRNPSASQVNALARSIQEAEPERLAELETKRAINEARLKTAQATLDRPEFEGKVYTVNGVTFAQTSRGGAQVIDTGTETPEQSTAQIQNFEFTLDQIDKAREAYSAGDVPRANDILTAAGIQKNGIDVTANEYFGDFTPPPPPGSTPQVTDTQFDPSQLTGQDREAYNFAINNPNDERSQRILNKLGAN